MREWRDELLQKSLVTASKSLSYPAEIEVEASGYLVVLVGGGGEETRAF